MDLCHFIIKKPICHINRTGTVWSITHTNIYFKEAILGKEYTEMKLIINNIKLHLFSFCNHFD